MRQGQRLFAGLACSVVAVILAAPMASASGAAANREDALGDALAGKGDVATSNFQVTFNEISHTIIGVNILVTTLRGSDPVTAPAWHNTNTAIRALLDVTATHVGPDFRVTLSAVGPDAPFEFRASVESLLSGEPVPVTCDATATFTAPNRYKGVLPALCFGDTVSTRVRERVEMTWDPPPVGGAQGTDRAPDHGWSPFIEAPT